MFTSAVKKVSALCLFVFVFSACSSAFQAKASPSEALPAPTRADAIRPYDTAPAPKATPTPPAAPDLQATPAPTRADAIRPYETSQIGLNFIRFYWNDDPRRDSGLNTSTDYYQPEWIFNDFSELGIHTYRQFVRADLLWNIVEPQDNQWNFTAADAVLLAGQPFEPIVTLFAMQYASPTPPWVKNPAQFEKVIGPEAEEYLRTVVQRYAGVVKYWELGNEMDHWRAADPGATQPKSGNNPAGKKPQVAPQDGFSPQEQGAFLAQAAAIIRQSDPDAVIVLPGMSGMDDFITKTWLPGVVEGGGGTDWFDIVNYHYYPSWERYGKQRQNLQAALETLGLADKPVWLTETGASAAPEIDVRTNYPNSPEAQAADIFRRIVQAYGAGDELVMWHTYISSPLETDNSWALYGVRTDTGVAQPSYAALKLLIDEMIPFAQVETLAADARGLNVYRITTQTGQTRYVAWGKGSWSVPQGVSESTSVVPGADGTYTWQAVQSGTELELSVIPVLLR